MIKCPNCGAELNFNVESQFVTCEHCRSKFNPKEFTEKVKTAEELTEKVKTTEEQTYEGKSYLCSQCGATLLAFDETAITFCSYCGSQAMIESKMIKHNNPDFIIPFKKTQQECITSYKKKISKSLFAPSYMKSDIVVNKFRGIYIPYCVYKLSFKGKTSHKGERYKYSLGDYKYYDDYEISAEVNAEYDGISYDLISDFYDKFSHSIPHDFKEVESFNPNYLAGFYADAVDVDKTLYEDIAKTIASNDSVTHMTRKKEFKKYGCYLPRVKFDVTEKKVGMFPIYFLAIRDKDDKYVHYAVVNGQTGKVAADLPVDFKKYILISFLLTIPIFLLINNLLVITPKVICIFSIIAAIISLIISNNQLKKSYERKYHLDDIGYLRKTTNAKYIVSTKDSDKGLKLFMVVMFAILAFLAFFTIQNMDLYFENVYMGIVLFIFFMMFLIPLITSIRKLNLNNPTSSLDVIRREFKIDKMEKFKFSYKAILAIIIGIIVLICNFVDDLYYYGSALITLSFVIWSFSDLIKGHNLLVSTELPQLEKRGGDENE